MKIFTNNKLFANFLLVLDGCFHIYGLCGVTRAHITHIVLFIYAKESANLNIFPLQHHRTPFFCVAVGVFFSLFIPNILYHAKWENPLCERLQM